MPRRFPSALAALFALAGAAFASDWPQWRGPNRDGVAEGVSVPAKWPAELKRRWSVEVGEGHSGPVVVGERVFQFARAGDDEVLRCLNLRDGSEAWSAKYAAPYEMNDAARSHGKGPKSTPAVADGRVFTLGIGGILSCCDAEKGTLIWRTDFAKEFPATSPLYGAAMSPLAFDGHCIAHVGGHDKGRLAAFDVKTGAVKWTASGDGPSYASPVLAKPASQPHLIALTQRELLGLDPSNGVARWKVPLTTEYDQNSVTPVVYGHQVIVSGYNLPLTSHRVERRPPVELTTNVAWTNKAFPLYMSTPVLAGHKLIGFSQRRSGQAFCVDPRNGSTLWESDGRLGENAAFIRAGDAIFMLTTEGKLMVLDAKAERYQPLAEYKVADTATWAHPAAVDSGILVKDKSKLALWSWGEK